jgi:hypothetical protein
MTAEEKKIFDEWLETRPESIKELAAKYPPGEYIIKEGAPYGISAPGTKVILHSYFEDGNVRVAVLAENKTAAGLEHERKLAEEYNKNVEDIHKQNVLVEIDPVWMEPDFTLTISIKDVSN